MKNKTDDSQNVFNSSNSSSNLTSKKSIKKFLNKKIYKTCRTHYLKWEIDDDWSIRYFLQFDTRPQYKHKWVLKSHKEKIYIILSLNEAKDYLSKYCIIENCKEIFSLIESGKGYRRFIIDRDGIHTFIEKNIK